MEPATFMFALRNECHLFPNSLPPFFMDVDCSTMAPTLPLVRARRVTPTVPLFRVFYKLCKQGHWFSFQNRAGKGCQPCLKDAPTSLKKWKDKFFLVDRRAAPIAMAWRHHDSSVADPFPRSSEYNASDVAKLREVVISLRRPPLSILYVAGLSNVWKHAGRAFSIRDSEGKVITMAEFLRLPNFKGCKVTAGALLPPGAARVTHLATPAARLQDIPPKTGEMMVAELLCRRVMGDKEKKKRKAEEKAATKVPADDNHAEAAVVAATRGAGVRKKRRVHASAQAHPVSDHVSSPTPLNQAKPLEALANETHVSPPGSVGRMDTLPVLLTPISWLVERVEKVKLTLPSLKAMVIIRMFCLVPRLALAMLIRLVWFYVFFILSLLHMFVLLTRGYSAGLFGNLPFTPQWGLTDSSRMDNSRECRDMLANLFTPADEEFFNEGVRDESAIRRSWKMLCQSTQQQANVLLRFEALKEQHVDLVYAHESCADVKVRFKECRKELAKVQSAYDEKTTAYDKLSKNYEGALIREKSLQDRLEELEEEKKEVGWEGEIVRQKIINQYFRTFVRRLHQSAEYKRSLGQVFSLAVGKGFIEGISIGRKEEDIQAILTATPNVDPSSSETFLPAYEKLFDQRYSYVDNVAHMYLLDPTELQNIMPDETGPTPGGGPRDTPTPS
ncbi:V-type proton ATPase subunit B2 [Tanacetum coccineum]